MTTPDPTQDLSTRTPAQRLRDGAGLVDHARVAVTGKAIPVLQRAVKLTRFPTLLVMAAPIISGIALGAVSLLIDHSARWVLLGIALVILLIGAAFGAKRKALQAAVQDREELTNEFVQAFSASNAWGKIQPELTRMSSEIRGARQGFAVVRSWRNLLSVAGQVTSLLDEYPRVAPFSPSSLRNTWLLGILCLVAGFIGAALAVLMLILKGLGAV